MKHLKTVSREKMVEPANLGLLFLAKGDSKKDPDPPSTIGLSL